MSLKYTPDTFYYVLAFNRRQFENWRSEHNVRRDKCMLIDTVAGTEGIAGFTSPERELVGLISWADNKSGEFLQACMRLQAMYCRDRGVHKIPMEMTIV